MAQCEVCGNNYDKSFEVIHGGTVAHVRQLRVRHSSARADVCALPLQDRRPRHRGERHVLLLRALREEIRREGSR